MGRVELCASLVEAPVSKERVKDLYVLAFNSEKWVAEKLN